MTNDLYSSINVGPIIENNDVITVTLNGNRAIFADSIYSFKDKYLTFINDSIPTCAVMTLGKTYQIIEVDDDECCFRIKDDEDSIMWVYPEVFGIKHKYED